MNMSEFIVIQVGQCGNQIGGQFWKLALQEYGIFSGDKITGSQSHLGRNTIRHTPLEKDTFFDFSDSFFWNFARKGGKSCKSLADLKGMKVKAKVIMVDMEDGVISQLQNSKLGHLFDNDLKLTHYPGSGNNWVLGHKMHGNNFHDALSKIISRAVEKCDNLQGFILLCSLGGGTGSGLGTFILKILDEEFGNVERFVGCVYPEENDDVITSPYNVLLSSRELTEHATCVFPFDNKALINICSKIKLHDSKTSISSKTLIPSYLPSVCKPFQDMNSIIVNMLLHLTSSSRFPGSLNLDINEIYSNMVPFPKMHFISSGLSPLYNLNLNVSPSSRQDEIFVTCWSRNNQLCRCIDPMNSTLLAVSLIGRGSITMAEMRNNIEKLQTKAKFAPWSVESIKVGLCSMPPNCVPSSLLCLFNSTGIVNLFDDILNKFAKLYTRKAHLHHYLVEGMEVSDIEECQSCMIDVVTAYKDVNAILPDNFISNLQIH